MGVNYLDIWTICKVKETLSREPYVMHNTGDFDASWEDSHACRNFLDAYTVLKLKETLEYAISGSVFYKEKYGSLYSAYESGLPASKLEHFTYESGLPASKSEPFTYESGSPASKSEPFMYEAACAAYKKEHSDCRRSMTKAISCTHDHIQESMTKGFMDFFTSLPFSTSQELSCRGLDFLCVSPSEISRIVTLDTGGSTGIPKRVYFTEQDQQLTVDYFENGMQLLVDSSDKILILMPAKMPGSIGKLLSKGLHNFGASTIDYGLPEMSHGKTLEENMEEAGNLLELIESEKVTSVVALPTHMRMMAECAMRNKDRQRNAAKEKEYNLKSVLLSAEYVSDKTVEFIEKVFNCKVYEHYGMTEMGLGCAVSCGQCDGYHVRESDLYIEIIDPDTGTSVKDGDLGEVVFTTLTRNGMPFIRYRTGDYSRWIMEDCKCGSFLKRLAKVGPRDVVKGYLK